MHRKTTRSVGLSPLSSLTFLLASFIFFSCSSSKKYFTENQPNFSPERMWKDVDFQFEADEASFDEVYETRLCKVEFRPSSVVPVRLRLKGDSGFESQADTNHNFAKAGVWIIGNDDLGIRVYPNSLGMAHFEFKPNPSFAWKFSTPLISKGYSSVNDCYEFYIEISKEVLDSWDRYLYASGLQRLRGGILTGFGNSSIWFPSRLSIRDSVVTIDQNTSVVAVKKDYVKISDTIYSAYKIQLLNQRRDSLFAVTIPSGMLITFDAPYATVETFPGYVEPIDSVDARLVLTADNLMIESEFLLEYTDPGWIVFRAEKGVDESGSPMYFKNYIKVQMLNINQQTISTLYVDQDSLTVVKR